MIQHIKYIFPINLSIEVFYDLIPFFHPKKIIKLDKRQKIKDQAKYTQKKTNVYLHPLEFLEMQIQEARDT